MTNLPPIPDPAWPYQLPPGKYEGMTLPAEFYMAVSRPTAEDIRQAAELREQRQREQQAASQREGEKKAAGQTRA